MSRCYFQREFHFLYSFFCSMFLLLLSFRPKAGKNLPCDLDSSIVDWKTIFSVQQWVTWTAFQQNDSDKGKEKRAEKCSARATWDWTEISSESEEKCKYWTKRIDTLLSLKPSQIFHKFSILHTRRRRSRAFSMHAHEIILCRVPNTIEINHREISFLH